LFELDPARFGHHVAFRFTASISLCRLIEYIWGMDGQVLRCPWHGWEFDLKSGVVLYA